MAVLGGPKIFITSPINSPYSFLTSHESKPKMILNYLWTGMLTFKVPPMWLSVLNFYDDKWILFFICCSYYYYYYLLILPIFCRKYNHNLSIFFLLKIPILLKVILLWRKIFTCTPALRALLYCYHQHIGTAKSSKFLEASNQIVKDHCKGINNY